VPLELEVEGRVGEVAGLPVGQELTESAKRRHPFGIQRETLLVRRRHPVGATAGQRPSHVEERGHTQNEGDEDDGEDRRHD